MADAAVSARGLSKHYRLGERARLGNAVARVFGRGAIHAFDALHDVSFDVDAGECLGIVGVNGSGKSTLLQILAGITVPTRGEMTVRGSVLPLLAVGAGFHQDLTGRENTILFGTILGLPRSAILGSLDRIAAFAEVERHFDTPVKRYSQGMQSRLSFALGMVFPADIYCFDEVLAVIDGEFRERCLGQIGALATAGSTVFFTSHDLDQVQRLCDRVMWLDGGELLEIGRPLEVLERYRGRKH